MTIKDYFSEAKACHYNAGTFFAGIIAGGFNIISKKTMSVYHKIGQNSLNKYIVKKDEIKYYDFNGVKVAKMPWGNFNDILCVHCYYNDDYSKEIVDKFKGEGPYCYKDNDIDVTVKEG